MAANTRLTGGLGGGAARAFLDRRTSHRPIGAKDATIALLGPQYFTAILAIIKELAGIGRHGFRFPVAAMRAGQGRFEFDHWGRLFQNA